MSLLDWLFETGLGIDRGSASVVDPRCPYCGSEFDPPPSRKTKCPSCGNQIHVATRPDRRRYLVTREQARAIEAEHLLVRQREQAASKVFINQIALEAAFEI